MNSRLGAVLTLLALLLASLLVLLGSGNSCPSFHATGDLDNDGIKEEYTLKDNTLTVKEGDQVLWKSPKDYQVDGFVLGDADNDGKINLVFSVWKKGSFGKIQPFWHTGEDTDYKNHLFVYKLQDDSMKPVWCSSNLNRPILSFTIRDVNNDGQNELSVKEGQYKKAFGHKYTIDPHGETKATVWKWEEWGFELCDSPAD